LLKTSHREKNWSTLRLSVSTKSIPEVSGSSGEALVTDTDTKAKTNARILRGTMLAAHFYLRGNYFITDGQSTCAGDPKEVLSQEGKFLLSPLPHPIPLLDGKQEVELDCIQRCHAADTGIPLL
jgi:hypothetical protein